jgi:transcriptional regulator with XRE-family HTH domain
LAELHYTHIGRFERGTSRPSGDTLKRLADALGVTSDYLLDGATDEAAKARFEDRELSVSGSRTVARRGQERGQETARCVPDPEVPSGAGALMLEE